MKDSLNTRLSKAQRLRCGFGRATAQRVCPQHKPADKIADDIGMTHDDLEAVLLLLGVGAVDVAAEGCLNAGPIFVVLLEDGREVDRHLQHKKRGGSNSTPAGTAQPIHGLRCTL